MVAAATNRGRVSTRVYHFTNREHGLEDIARRRLKVATIEDLNDPFELLGPEMSDKRYREKAKRFRKQFAESYGMLCFCQTWRNPLLWGHYADKHRGLCLGFDVPRNARTSVLYSPSRLDQHAAVLDNASEDEAMTPMLEMLRTKFIDWCYEAEERAFVALADMCRQGDLYFACFSKRLVLREVWVGAESTISRAEVEDVLGDLRPQVVTRKARLAFKTYEIVRQRDESLWK